MNQAENESRLATLNAKIELAEWQSQLFLRNIDEAKTALSADSRAMALGRFFEASEQFEDAETVYSLLEGSEESVEFVVRRALVALKSGDLQKGERLAKRAAELDASYTFETLAGKATSVQTVLGDSRKARGDYSGALKAYNRAMELADDDAHASGGAATCLVKMGRTTEAKELAPKLVHPSYSGLRSTLELFQGGSAGPSIESIEQNVASLVGKFS